MLISKPGDLFELGRVVLEERKALGWKQNEMAERAGVTQGSLSRFERSGFGLRVENVLKVLSALGLGLEVIRNDATTTSNESAS